MAWYPCSACLPASRATFRRQSPLFYNFFPMTQYSRFLEDSLASSTGLRLPACTLFYAPKQNTRDTSGLIFRTLSAPLSNLLPTTSLSFITCNPIVTPQITLSSVRLSPSRSKATRDFTWQF